jgi:uncharacterized membrane protein YbhN (UPF0104 family)
MNKRVSLALQYIVFLGLGVFLVWWSVRNLTEGEVEQLKGALRNARYLLVLPAMVMLLLSHYSRALRWRMLMEPLGFTPRASNTFLAVMLGYFFNLLVPRMGEVMKCTMLARYEKTPVDRLIGTMVAERALDVVCLALVIALTFLLQTDLAGQFLGAEFEKLAGGFKGAGGLTGILLAAAAAIGGAWLFFEILKRFSHIGWIAKTRGLILGVMQGLTSIRLIRRKTVFLLHTLFIWSMYLGSIYVGFQAMEPVRHLGLNPSLTILSVGSLAMIVTQGGIGAYQIAVQKSLELYGVGAVDGLAFGWLLWAFQTILILVAGILCLILLPLINRTRNESIV